MSTSRNLEAPVGVGVDIGATLAKIAIREAKAEAGGKVSEPLRFELLPATALHDVAGLVEGVAPTSVGLTGGGAARLSAQLSCPWARVNEFAAWGSGAALLRDAARGAAQEPYLLVSIGTGTSVLLVNGISVVRTGGTALGGGTVMGLAAALFGEIDFEALCQLADRGRHQTVDLLVSDIYPAGEIPLGADLTASSFGKLARLHQVPGPRSSDGIAKEDLAAAVMGLVGENIALICGGLASSAQVREIVFAGSTLRSNPALQSVLGQVTRAFGRSATFLPDGEFAGALGSLELARERR